MFVYSYEPEHSQHRFPSALGYFDARLIQFLGKALKEGLYKALIFILLYDNLKIKFNTLIKFCFVKGSCALHLDLLVKGF